MAPRHPYFNGSAENLGRTFTSTTTLASASNLVQYRKTRRSRAHKSSAQLFKSLIFRSHLVNRMSSKVQFHRRNSCRTSTGIGIRSMGNRTILFIEVTTPFTVDM